jgi:putative ABC transport system substrate-binding protein
VKINGGQWSIIRKSVFCFALYVILFTVCSPTRAQQSGKIFRIGFLDATTASGSAGLLDTFRQEMRKLGWIEGKNITIEYRFAEQKPERLAELAADLVDLKVEVIMVPGNIPALVAKKATSGLKHLIRV